MVFSSTVFLFAFFPLYIAAVSLVRNIRACNIILVILSLFFYAWGEPVFILVMLLSVFVNYLLALPALRCRDKDGILKRTLLTLSIVFNLTLLILFKYAGFIVTSLNTVTGMSLPVPQILLPVGISFFTFQTMSYVIDVYRGRCQVQKNIGKFTLYVSFFPQLIAGPIIKYHDIEKQLDCRSTDSFGIAGGIRRFIVGLSKKILIANSLGCIVDDIYSLEGSDMNILLAWIAAILYSLQIYFDFSGYSDMAIGLGKMAGFRIPENFNYPFTALSLRDFWKRWHISLTTWFREYVYIPLGGNRKGEVRTGINKMAVFLLTGIWHGAMWTFVLWGVFHGVFQLLETYFIRPEKWKKPLAYIYTMVVVAIGFSIFRAESLGQAASILKALFFGYGFTDAGVIMLQGLFTLFNGVIFAAAILAMTPAVRNWIDILNKKQRARNYVVCMKYAASVVLMALCMMSLASSSYNPFIYFRF